MALQSYLPYQFILETPYSPAAVAERLNTYVEPIKLRWIFAYHHAPYQGKVSAREFKITRIIHYRNSFLPRIRGQIESSPTGSIVKVRVQLHPVIIPFLILWLLVWFGALIVINPIPTMPTLASIIFFLIPIFILAVLTLAFGYEATHSQKDLEKIIQSDLLQVRKYFNAQQKARQRFRIWHIISFIPAIFFGFVFLT